MDDIALTKDFLKQLVSLPGISGYETPVTEVIAEKWKTLTDDVRVTNIGNLYAIKKGSLTLDGKPAKQVVMAVHMDGIGMVVERIVGEMLYFAPIGGFDPRILPGQEVMVHARSGEIHGVIVQLAPHIMKEPYQDVPVPLDQLVIDTGLEEAELCSLVAVGDTVSYANLPMDIPKECIAGHSLDNRASVAAVTHCLSLLQRFKHEWDVTAIGTVQEETKFLSGTTVYDLKPDIVIVIDVTFAKGPGVDGWKVKALESGPSIGFGANLHPFLFGKLKEIAEELDIPYTLDPAPNMSGTDADPMQVAAGGVPVCLLGIPLRYMHTPVEVIAMKDITRTGRLMAEFIARLTSDFDTQIVWED